MLIPGEYQSWFIVNRDNGSISNVFGIDAVYKAPVESEEKLKDLLRYRYPNVNVTHASNVSHWILTIPTVEGNDGLPPLQGYNVGLNKNTGEIG